MDDTLWRLFHVVKFKECYMGRYCAYCRSRSNWITITGLVLSSASIAGWFTIHLPALWSILLLIAQAMQIVKPFLRYERHMDSLKYLLPETSGLVIDVEHSWRKTREASPDELSDLLKQFRERYNALECKYCGVDSIPRIKSVDKAASEDAKDFFTAQYDTDWSDTSVSETSVSSTTNTGAQTGPNTQTDSKPISGET